MKKFLSLVLAMIMTMSLVTISAGATEYKDLTDKDEIQYEEAVAVLNRIGVITGYSDGSFRPETELTRGAAAKIIVSLLIGPDAANNLTITSAPYPDVPTSHTFAAVISFCKTSKIISGYSDGTFRPDGSLTGYAFAKMLLGAVGYSADLEGFTGSGWTMNVANIGQSAGLFDRLNFQGNEPVNREQACQLALNTLKATVVQYSQGINVNVTGDNTNVQVSGGQTRSYKTSNQEFARNIRVRGTTGNLINNVNDDYYTVEFAEEHFVDLRLEHDKYNPTPDEFGRPSAEWSYKKVTIGTYALEPDFQFTTQIAHKEATEAVRERATGLRDYDLEGVTSSGARTTNTTVWWNGVEDNATLDPAAGAKIADIADLTDNGTLVQVYVSNYDADFITDVVVIQTQLMEVKRVGSDYVSLDRISPNGNPTEKYGFNQPAIHVNVENVREEDDYYTTLSALKAGDKVAVIPVAITSAATTDFKVGRAYVPETVTGKLEKVTTYGSVGTDRVAMDITVGGTKYNLANWNKGMWETDADIIKITKSDVKLTLDEYGNALKGDDFGETSEYMVVGSFGLATQNNRLVHLVEGWTVGGDAVTLNVGNVDYSSTSGGHDVAPGDLVKYTSEGTTGNAEWRILESYDAASAAAADIYDVLQTDEIKSSNVRLKVDIDMDDPTTDDDSGNDFYYAEGVKFIYVSFDSAGDVDTIEFVKGVQNVTTTDLAKNNDSWSGSTTSNAAQAYTDDDYIQAVVIKTESNNANNNNLMYVIDFRGTGEVDQNNNPIWGYTVAMVDENGDFVDDAFVYSTRKLNIGDFARFTKTESPIAEYNDHFYSLSRYEKTENTTSVALIQGINVLLNSAGKYSKDIIQFSDAYKTEYLEDVLDFDVAAADGPMVADTATRNPANNQKGYAAIVSGYRGLADIDGSNAKTLRIGKNAKWLDLREHTNRDEIGSVEDLVEDDAQKYVPSTLTFAIIFNDNKESDGFREVSRVIVLTGLEAAAAIPAPSVAISFDADAAAGKDSGEDITLTAEVTNMAALLRDGVRESDLTYQWMRWDSDAIGGAAWVAEGAPVTGNAGKTHTTELSSVVADNKWTCVVSHSKNVGVAAASDPDTATVNGTAADSATPVTPADAPNENEAKLTINIEDGLTVMNGSEPVLDGDVLTVRKGVTVTLTVAQFTTDATKVLDITNEDALTINAPAEDAFGEVKVQATKDGTLAFGTKAAPLTFKVKEALVSGYKVTSVKVDGGAEQKTAAIGESGIKVDADKSIVMVLTKDDAGDATAGTAGDTLNDASLTLEEGTLTGAFVLTTPGADAVTWAAAEVEITDNDSLTTAKGKTNLHLGKTDGTEAPTSAAEEGAEVDLSEIADYTAYQASSYNGKKIYEITDAADAVAEVITITVTMPDANVNITGAALS